MQMESLAAAVPRAATPLADADPDAGPAAFWALWLEHRLDLRRQSLRLSSGNRAEAEDALGDAMVKAAQAYSCAGVRQPRAWLRRFVHNACIDRHRARRRSDRAATEVVLNAAAAPFACGTPARSPEELLSAAEERERLRRALRALPAHLAKPLALHLDDVSDVDIAERLTISRALVRKRRQLAREWLRRRLAS